MKLFSPDSPGMRFLSLVADAMIVGLLWLLTSIAIITIGASTTAAYYVLMRRISDREGSITSDYFLSFRENFKNATIIFVILTALSAVNIYNFFYNPVEGTIGIIINILQIIIAAQLAFVYLHIFPLASRSDLGIKQLFKTSLIIANKHVFTTLTLIALTVALTWVSLSAPFIIAFSMGFYCWLSSYMLIKVYRRYKPEMDKDFDADNETRSEEDDSNTS